MPTSGRYFSNFERNFFDKVVASAFEVSSGTLSKIKRCALAYAKNGCFGKKVSVPEERFPSRNILSENDNYEKFDRVQYSAGNHY